ncbi:3D domain-containing protein [Robertmurraya sp. DFI.2.37]|uniref:3D domain-containing protein n=1 Tax=Robertmurraya TaxID=2837507 RepID=UPI000BA53593|nr:MULTISPECIES: 3D domain-containing protein [Robertmurraya]MDF1509966.1 3D domain-containing protein [Robertmurraya sp. DFI.2.37]PAE19337.1 radical SAM protein [Bacillus sp. 7504-2]
MHSLKRGAIALTSVVLFSTSIVANAETSQGMITSSQNKLQQNAEKINEKKVEKQEIAAELQNVQKELKAIETEIVKTTETINALEEKINKTKQIIEDKKEEIIVLQDKVHTRKEVMEDRLVSLQHNDQVNAIVAILLNAESITDLFERVSAVTTILGADKDLLEQQRADLAKIEEEKIAIDQQEEKLEKQYTELAASQTTLDNSLQKRQQELAAVQAKYDAVNNEIHLAEKEKELFQKQLTQAQNKLKQERQNAVKTANVVNQNKTQAKSRAPKENSTVKNTMYVTATAYSHESSKTGLTYMGYNIRKNPNMKLIAVDPSVIPLGSKVWVEGYGEAIAGDTGGAIKGHKIDVLMPNDAQAIRWGRKVVKISILN